MTPERPYRDAVLPLRRVQPSQRRLRLQRAGGARAAGLFLLDALLGGLDVAHRKKIELTRDKSAAALAGGKAAGDFLEQLGQTDMAQLSRVEWAEFCERLIRGYLEELQRQADAQVPF